MDTFYCSEIQEGLCNLSQDESHHATRVLRKKEGQPVRLIDGKGRVGLGAFQEVHKKNCVVLVDEIVDSSEANLLAIAIAPTKNLDRLEWFLEKTTELGIHQIIPILCQHSERKVIRVDRLRRVIMAATKQSLSAFLPILANLTPYSAFISSLAQKYEHKYIAYCGEGPQVDISDISKQGGNTIVLIGPEGDFSPVEYDLALKNGFIGLSLGKSRLRTETAGIYVAAAFRFLHD